MPRFESSIEIRAEPDAVFALTHDYARRLEWDTLLSEARLLDGADRAGKGVNALCVGRRRFLGLWIESVYITFDPPRSAAVEMTRGSRIFETFAASFRNEHAGHGVTRVTYSGHVTTRPRWLRAVVEPLVGAAFRRETRKRLAALKRVLETSPWPAGALAEMQSVPCPEHLRSNEEPRRYTGPGFPYGWLRLICLCFVVLFAGATLLGILSMVLPHLARR